MLRSKRSSVAPFLCATLLLALVAGAAAAKPAGVALADGVVVDVESRVTYMLNPAGGIDAVELGSGSLRWTVDAVAKPLLAVGDLLLAQAEGREAGRLDIVSFDVRDGAPGELRARLDLPEDLVARLHDSPQSTFRVSAYLRGEEVILAWNATKAAGEMAQGYLPSTEEGMVPALDKSQTRPAAPADKSPRLFEGVVRLDLASGRVAPAAKAADAPRPLDVLNERLEGMKGRLYTSADGRHVLASVRDTTEEIWQGYRWKIYARESGKRLGEVSHYTFAAPFVVADNSLLFVSRPYFRRQGDDIEAVPLLLRAVDLASGAELWTKELDDPSFYGPQAP